MDWLLLPAVAESSSPALGSGPSSGPTLEGLLLGYPDPGPGPASPGRCRRWAPGLSAGPGLPAPPPGLAPLLPAWPSLHPPTHVPTRPKGLGMGRGRKEVTAAPTCCPVTALDHATLNWYGNCSLDERVANVCIEFISGRLCTKCLSCMAYLILPTALRDRCLWRHTQVWYLVPGHLASRWQSQWLKPGPWSPEPLLLTTTLSASPGSRKTMVGTEGRGFAHTCWKKRCSRRARWRPLSTCSSRCSKMSRTFWEAVSSPRARASRAWARRS